MSAFCSRCFSAARGDGVPLTSPTRLTARAWTAPTREDTMAKRKAAPPEEDSEEEDYYEDDLEGGSDEDEDGEAAAGGGRDFDEEEDEDEIHEADMLHGHLFIDIFSAKDLPDMESWVAKLVDPKDVTDAYVDVELGKAKIAKTSVILNDLNPVWNETFRLDIL